MLIAVCLAVTGLLLAVAKVPLGGALLASSVIVTVFAIWGNDSSLKTGKRREYKQHATKEETANRDSLYIYIPPTDNTSNTPKRVIREGNYAAMSKDIKSRDKSNRRRISKPSSTPRKVLVMLQNDLNQALRLYEGVANRNPDKGSQWIWERVASDLERDRR
ncbi:MAG: hypothetical protein ACK5RE_17945 [Pseudanabaena sp.]